MSTPEFERLKAFFETRDVAVRAAGPLKDGTLIRITILGDASDYHISREHSKTLLCEGPAPADPKLTFSISPRAIERLADYPSDSIGEFGVEFFRIMVSDDPELELSVKLHTGFLGLTRMGVFGILKMGGKEVMVFLGKNGLKSLGAIRKAISKMMG